VKRAALKRKARLKPRRSTPRKSGRKLWPEYLDAVRTLDCYACGRPGPSDPDHQGPRPYGRKTDDDTAVPLCRMCHRWRTDGKVYVSRYEDDARGTWVMRGWEDADKHQMRAWCSVAIAATRAVVYPMLGLAVPAEGANT
jgi:hypothetical protein